MAFFSSLALSLSSFEICAIARALTIYRLFCGPGAVTAQSLNLFDGVLICQRLVSLFPGGLSAVSPRTGADPDLYPVPSNAKVGDKGILVLFNALVSVPGIFANANERAGQCFCIPGLERLNDTVICFRAPQGLAECLAQ